MGGGGQDWIPILSSLSPAGLLGLGVLLLMFGRLVPRSIMLARMADKDAIIGEQRGYITSLERNNALLRLGNEATVGVVTATAEGVTNAGG